MSVNVGAGDFSLFEKKPWKVRLRRYLFKNVYYNRLTDVLFNFFIYVFFAFILPFIIMVISGIGCRISGYFSETLREVCVRVCGLSILWISGAFLFFVEFWIEESIVVLGAFYEYFLYLIGVDVEKRRRKKEESLQKFLNCERSFLKCIFCLSSAGCNRTYDSIKRWYDMVEIEEIGKRLNYWKFIKNNSSYSNSGAPFYWINPVTGEYEKLEIPKYEPSTPEEREERDNWQFRNIYQVTKLSWEEWQFCKELYMKHCNPRQKNLSGDCIL